MIDGTTLEVSVRHMKEAIRRFLYKNEIDRVETK